VVESLNITYVLFSSEGIPWRAKLSLALKEYRPVEIQVAESPSSSPDVEKFHTLVRGETLAVVAWKAFGDPTLWREIAAHNAIKDPRHIAPGTVLNIPRLR
jgi:nucleoid-associated protein YgaU